jgi:hypothetical protein
MRRRGRLQAGEKSPVGTPLPEPNRDQSQVHRQQDKGEKQIDSVKPQ